MYTPGEISNTDTDCIQIKNNLITFVLNKPNGTADCNANVKGNKYYFKYGLEKLMQVIDW